MEATYRRESGGDLAEIAGLMAAATDSGTIEIFLRSLLSPKEIDNLALRWEIFKLLSQGVSQRKISGQLGVSLCKITRGSREMKDKSRVILEMIERAKTIKILD